MCFISGFLIIYLMFLKFDFWFILSGLVILCIIVKKSIKVLPLCTLPSIVSEFFDIKTKLLFFQAFLCSFLFSIKEKRMEGILFSLGTMFSLHEKKKVKKEEFSFLPILKLRRLVLASVIF